MKSVLSQATRCISRSSICTRPSATRASSVMNRQRQIRNPHRSFGHGKKDSHHPEHHHHAEEHAVHEHHHHHPEPQSMQAVLWQGHSTEPEGWERTVYVTYAAAAVLLGLTLGFAPDTSIHSWAEGEARARLDMQAQGTLDTPSFGTHYNTAQTRFLWESKIVDDPFDEDEEEEEAEEAEENNDVDEEEEEEEEEE